MKQEDIQKIRQTIHISPERKDEIKRILMARVDERVRVAGLDRRTVQNTTIRRVLFARISATLIFLIVFAVVGIGTSLAANNSLPGDRLYPIKVNINEKVVGLLAVGDKAKLDWEAHLADERLKEAEVLDKENKLAGQVKEELKRDFDSHVDRTERVAREIDIKSGNRDSNSETSKFKDRLRGRKAIIDELGKSEDSNSDRDGQKNTHVNRGGGDGSAGKSDGNSNDRKNTDRNTDKEDN